MGLGKLTLVIIFFTSSFVLAETISIKHCNLDFAAQAIKQKIEQEARELSNADPKSLDVTFVKEFLSLDPVVERTYDYTNSNVYWNSIVTGYFRINASVNLRDGKVLRLLRDYFRLPKFEHVWDDLIVEIKLSNKFENRLFYSNSCQVTIIGGSKTFWGYVNPVNDDYPFIEYDRSDLSGSQIHQGPFEQNEAPQVGL